MSQDRVECIHCRELIIKGASVCPHCKLQQVSVNKQGTVGLLHKAARIYLILAFLGLVVGIIGYLHMQKRHEAAMTAIQAQQLAVQQQMAQQNRAMVNDQAAARKQFDDAQHQFDAAQKKRRADMEKAREDAQRKFDEARQNQSLGQP